MRYFAAVRDRTGKSEETLEVGPDPVAGDVLAAVVDRYPTVGPLRGRLRLAVNEEFVAETTPVREGDEIALIPPVAGGADACVRVSESPLSLDDAMSAVRHPGAGGICVFVGVVRDENAGHAVTSLDYEAFSSMATREMAKIAAEIEAEVPGARLAALHRVGSLAIGDAAVVIAASAPHRAEAFQACRAMIDRIKERVPIWKREHGPAGVDWVGL